MPVAVPVFFCSGRACAGPVQLVLQIGAQPGCEQSDDLAAHSRIERRPHHAGDVAGPGSAKNRHTACGQC
jgi:hypothetical protein